MIWRRFTPFCKLTIFWVVIALSGMRLSSKQLYIDTLMISTRRLAKNDDLAASDTILQISHILVVIGWS